MRVTFLGTTSGNTNCPTLWETDRGTYLAQGKIVTDPEALAAVRGRGNGIPDDETIVEIPKALLKFAPEGN
jgi:hypothetical protein